MSRHVLTSASTLQRMGRQSLVASTLTKRRHAARPTLELCTPLPSRAKLAWARSGLAGIGQVSRRQREPFEALPRWPLLCARKSVEVDCCPMTVALAVFLLAYTTRYALAVNLPVYPLDMPPMMTRQQADHANAVLAAAGLTHWFECPLVGRVTSMMVTLADGLTYDLIRAAASCLNSDTLESPEDRHMAIPDSLAFAFVNLDLMDIIREADALVESLRQGQIPEAVRPWIQSPMRQSIWICEAGRSHFSSFFTRPFTIEALGMLLVQDTGKFCFRNLRLESVVDRTCTLVDCRTRGTSQVTRQSSLEYLVRMDTVMEPVSPDPPMTLTTWSQTCPSAARSSSHASIPSRLLKKVDASSSRTSTASHSPPSRRVSLSENQATDVSRPSTDDASTSVLCTGIAETQAAGVCRPGSDDESIVLCTGICTTFPWPNSKAEETVPSLPAAIPSACAATIAYTRSLDDTSLWDWSNLTCTARRHLNAARFWAWHYRTTFKITDTELPPKPTSDDDIDVWQASCHRYFQAAEGVVVRAVLEKQGSTGALGMCGASVNRHSWRLRALVKRLGLVEDKRTTSFAASTCAADASWPADVVDRIPWPSTSEVKPAPPLLPAAISSAWAATIAYTRSLDYLSLWDWSNLTYTARRHLRAARFWASQYSTTFKPADMELPSKPISQDDLKVWQASCYRYFLAAEGVLVNAILEKRGNTGAFGMRGASVNRHSWILRTLVIDLGLVPPPRQQRDRKRNFATLQAGSGSGKDD